jgi:hypothetical protein
MVKLMHNLKIYIYYNISMNFAKEPEKTPQIVYDSYNSLIFSDDTHVFQKMVKRIELYQNVKQLSGDIIEIGVFKGAGIALFLKLKAMYEPNSVMKVIGFDFFDKDNTLSNLSGINKEMMDNVLNRTNNNDILLDSVKNKLLFSNPSNYLLIKGEAVEKCNDFNHNNPGLRIKILYLDLDLGEPTYNILKIFWNKVVKNGIVVFDEYAHHHWDESVGVDKFLKEIEGQYEFIDTKIYTPSAYIKKLVI